MAAELSALPHDDFEDGAIVKRHVLLGLLLDVKTGRAFHSASPHTLRIVKRTEYEEYEREQLRRRFMRRVVVVCGVVLAVAAVAVGVMR